MSEYRKNAGSSDINVLTYKKVNINDYFLPCILLDASLRSACDLLNLAASVFLLSFFLRNFADAYENFFNTVIFVLGSNIPIYGLIYPEQYCFEVRVYDVLFTCSYLSAGVILIMLSLIIYLLFSIKEDIEKTYNGDANL